MKESASVTAILVAYNSAEIIGNALKMLVSAPEIDEIIVVDNCSSDATCMLIRRNFPTVILIENSGNVGLGRASNIGLERVKTSFALLINPDALLKEGALPLLLQAAKDYPDAAILAPALVNTEGRVYRNFKRNVFNREKKSGQYIEPQGECCAEFLSRAVMLLAMEQMKNIGYFDPNIFLFYEDDDLCIRARRAGYGLVFVPQAKAVHLKKKLPTPALEYFKQAHMRWSRLYLQFKYFGMDSAQHFAIKLHFVYAFKIVAYTLLGKFAKANRYRGRLKGVKAWNDSPGSAPTM
jgi:N-acetylglucosaminyl-diphospho-decaprenol L-rhamnosyltransferase